MFNPALFFFGFLLYLIRLFPLFLIALLLVIFGRKSRICRYIALGLCILAVMIALIQEFRIKYTVEHSDDPNFKPFAEAAMSDDWHDIIDTVDENIAGSTDDSPEG